MNINENLNSNKLPLKVGEVEIGKVTGSYKGEVYVFTVYYGNFLMPKVHGEYIHYKQDLYKKMLDSFLNSKEGEKYIRPSDEEIDEATQIVISQESQHITKQDQEIKEENLEEAKEEIQEINIAKDGNEEFVSLKSRTTAMFIIIIFQFICIATLVLLRIIKL